MSEPLGTLARSSDSSRPLNTSCHRAPSSVTSTTLSALPGCAAGTTMDARTAASAMHNARIRMNPPRKSCGTVYAIPSESFDGTNTSSPKHALQSADVTAVEQIPIGIDNGSCAARERREPVELKVAFDDDRIGDGSTDALPDVPERGRQVSPLSCSSAVLEWLKLSNVN